jgi:hypothetical protein
MTTGFTHGKTLINLLRSEDTTKQTLARELIRTYAKIDNYTDDCAELKGALFSCFEDRLDKRNKSSFNNSPTRVLNIHLRELRILCECGAPLDYFNKNITLLQKLVHFCLEGNGSFTEHRQQARIAISMLIYFGANLTPNTKVNTRDYRKFLFVKVKDDDKAVVLKKEFAKQSSFAKVRLVLLSFRERGSAFFLFPADIVNVILMYLGISQKVAIGMTAAILLLKEKDRDTSSLTQITKKRKTLE